MFQRAPLICLTGVDGCGKSTQAGILMQRLTHEGWDPALVWTGGRPYISRPAIKLVKRRLRAPVQQADGTFATRDGSADTTDEFSEYLGKTNRMFRKYPILRRGWTDVSLLEHVVEADLGVLPQLARGRAVVCDRYLFKSVVNLAVLLDLKLTDLPDLIRHPALKLVPWPTAYFLLDIPADVAAARKHDLPSPEYVERRVPYYRALAAYTSMPVVDATQSPDEVAEAIWETVSQVLNSSGMRPRHA
jgi:thymidylate kinase